MTICGSRQLVKTRRRKVCRMHAPESTLFKGRRKVTSFALEPVVVDVRKCEAHEGLDRKTRAERTQGTILEKNHRITRADKTG
jgi:hypothetical protein